MGHKHAVAYFKYHWIFGWKSGRVSGGLKEEENGSNRKLNQILSGQYDVHSCAVITRLGVREIKHLTEYQAQASCGGHFLQGSQD
jgi:hypothetical protein